VVSHRHEATQPSAPLADPFELVSIRSVEAPRGATGDDWYRYVIGQGVNEIVGFRAGERVDVTAAVEGIVERLNDRRRQGRGRVHVVLNPPARARSA